MNTPHRAAGAVVFRRSERGIRLLLLRAYRNWDFPKGLIDYPFGDEFKETLPYSGNKVARYYLARTEAADLLPPRLAAVLEWARKTLTNQEIRWTS